MKTPLILLLGLLSSNTCFAQIDEDTIIPPLIPLQVGATALPADGSEQMVQFQLEGDVRDVYVRVLTVSGAEVRVEVEAPDGSRIDADNAAAQGAVVQVIEFEEPLEVAGMITFFEQGRHWILKAPGGGPGTWRVRLRAPSGSSEPVGALVRISWVGEGGGLPVSTRTFRAEWERPFLGVQLGRPVTFTAELFESDAPLLGGGKAYLEATAPSGVKERVDLHDDGHAPDREAGDGVFAADFVPKETGEYEIRLYSSSPKKPEQRWMQDARLTAVPLSGDLTGNVRVTGYDQDGDGESENMAVFVEVDVLQAGRFLARVRLDDGSEWGRHDSMEANLEQGRGWIRVLFDLADLAKAGMASPFRIRELALARVSPKRGPQDIEWKEVSISADPTVKVEPKPEAVRIAGSLRSELIDDDSDGLADRLRLTLPLEIARYDELRSGKLVLHAVRFRAGQQETVQHEISFRDRQLSGRRDLVLELEGKELAYTDYAGPYTVSGTLRTRHGRTGFRLDESPVLRAEDFAAEEPRILAFHTKDLAFAGEQVFLDLEFEAMDERARQKTVQLGDFRLPAVTRRTSDSRAQLIFTVPWNTPAGDHPLRVNFGTREAAAPRPLTVLPARFDVFDESKAEYPVVATGRVRLVEVEPEGHEYRVEVEVRRPYQVKARLLFRHSGERSPTWTDEGELVALSPGTHELAVPADPLEFAMRGYLPDAIDQIDLDGAGHFSGWFPVRSLDSEDDFSEMPSLELAGPQNAHAEDIDGDGLFDGLLIDVPIRIRNADALGGGLFAYGMVYAAESRSPLEGAHPQSSEVPPVEGLQTLRLLVPGAPIATSGQDGPYRLPEFLVRYQKGRSQHRQGQLQLQIDGASPPYRADQFDPDATFSGLSASGGMLRTPELTVGELSSQTIDDDGDGLHDRLVFRIPVQMAADEPLDAVTASLGIVSEDGVLRVGARSEPRRLDVGESKLEVSFSSENVRFRETNGPYRVEQLRLSGKGLASVSYPVEYQTAPYPASDFAPVVPRLARGFLRGAARSIKAGAVGRISLGCKFTLCEGGEASSSDDVTVESVSLVRSGTHAILQISVASDAKRGWRPITLQTADGPLTLDRAFQVR